MSLAPFDLKKTAAVLGELLDYARNNSCCLDVRYEETWNGQLYITDLKPRTNADRFGDDLELALGSLLEQLKPTPAKIATVYDAEQLTGMFDHVRKAGGHMIFVADFRKPGGKVFSCSIASPTGSFKKHMGNDAGLVVFSAMTDAGI